MLYNYLKLSFRLLARNPFFTGINVVGLAVGFASFYVLWEYATTELKSDQYHKDFDRIARIGFTWEWPQGDGNSWGHLTYGVSNAAHFPSLAEENPEIESFARIRNTLRQDGIKLSVDGAKNQEHIFKEENFVLADSNLFSFFSIPLVYGQPGSVLNKANQVVLSQSSAIRYFGERDPRGEMVRVNDSTMLEVSGVFEDLPHQTHLNFAMVISNVGMTDFMEAPFTHVYVRLNNSDFKALESKLNRKVRELYADYLRAHPGERRISLFVQPLAEIAFSQHFKYDNFYPKSKPFLLTLAFIALSVLVMAWVNYINLSVTRTTRRFKEIATRKVSGANGMDMAVQFVTEALVTNLLAIGVAVTLIQLVRAQVSYFFNFQIASFSALSPSSITILFLIVLGGVLLSGLYPAIISMGYRPRALISMGTKGSGKRFVPALLTVGQFSAAIIFILLGFTVSLQLNHILNMDTGFHKEQIVVIDAPIVKPREYSPLLSTFKDKMRNLAAVTSVSGTWVNVNEEGHSRLSRPGEEGGFGLNANIIDEDFISLFNLKLIAGRNFIKDEPTKGVILSRTATVRVGFDSVEEAVGEPVIVNNVEAVVIGVIEDYRIAPYLNMGESSTETDEKGRGFVFIYKKWEWGEGSFISNANIEKIYVRVQPEDFQRTISSIQSLYDEQFPGSLFNWNFLDKKINEVYANEQVARNQIILFTGLAILIACLGLLGMITNKAIEKTKEIGVRKVLGAQLHQIALVLLKTTVSQIVVATVIGVPVAYYLTDQYLAKYSERIGLQWWHFTLPIILLTMIMFLTISTVLWRAAKNNPVEALKYE